MKTKVHQQLCKIYDLNLSFNNFLFAFHGNTVYVYDKKYLPCFLVLNLETNVLTNFFEKGNKYDLRCPLDTRTSVPAYLLASWEEKWKEINED